MFIKDYKKTKCPYGCILFNDDSNYHYWEYKRETSDETNILKYIKENIISNKSRILHIGIGNSYIANNINEYEIIDGITLSQNEINIANEQKKQNYNAFFQNKYSKNNIIGKALTNYDIIIDANLKSFSCCNEAFEYLFKLYSQILNKNGLIITGKKGMNWSRNVKPAWSFTLNKLFHKRLKEYNGPENNKLNEEECLSLANKYKLKFYNSETEIVYFKNE